MPVQAVGRFVTHGFDRRKVFRADLVRPQQLPSGVVTQLNQQVHRPLDQFGTADGVAMGQRPTSGTADGVLQFGTADGVAMGQRPTGGIADGVLQFGPVAPRHDLPVDPFGCLAFGGGCGAHGDPPRRRTPCYVTVTNRASGSPRQLVTVTGHPGSFSRATFHIISYAAPSYFLREAPPLLKKFWQSGVFGTRVW